MTYGRTVAKGYGGEHKRARKAAMAAFMDGDPCARCGKPMWLAEHGPLHLDHSDDRTYYIGLSHPSCNVAASNDIRLGIVGSRHSREW